MKQTAISIVVAAVLIAGAIVLTRSSPNASGQPAVAAHNVSVVDGKQIVDIAVKGGYSPSVSTAKADMPTTLRLQTNGTFDCTSAVTIAALGYRANLPPSGTTEVPVPPQKAGSSIRGVCIMGMYNFTVNFN